MEWDLKTIGIITALFFIGYIIGLVEAAIKQKNKDKKKAREEEKEKIELPPTPVKQPNLLSINRNQSNDLVLELGGQTITNKDELTPENRHTLVDLLVEMRPWLESSPATPVTPPFESQPEPPKVKPQVVPPVTPPLSVPPAQSPPVKPTGSIVSQIDSVLQARLVASPLSNLGIRLLEAPTGGVLVYIGLNKYEGIDSVPNPEIKAFIRQAVAEWEKQ
ncbi:MAG: hypothetical protein A2X25_14980 [Chloroflexi bacterium GWB2_49_20]|nr:MAG: hypothetical protein A2X25_14980 [Chloroflexi bacterium GWB2_49_20]OGN80437.1 MAG: hypothetical protein A2X26_12725 [Chloroflexi bacterium GWC2_49_37]OGN84261.1 MAG: hypothetical protein A2X27_12525 [Chloroflexi bacterium GWD2_49_16]